MQVADVADVNVATLNLNDDLAEVTLGIVDEVDDAVDTTIGALFALSPAFLAANGWRSDRNGDKGCQWA